ncbi:hypothetical protein HGRIS_014496 [Hohenbuehelia grisea]|uniref:FAS1 domain-containing protein n=1 Tax=Hohenbuehelia grisea TaxID=104357 RepID=A0ABR3JTV1_9AGAR
MVHLSSLILSVALLLPIVGAEPQGIEVLIETLQQHGLEQMSKYLSDCNKPNNDVGQRLIKVLSTGEGGPYTLFAPEDQAFEKVNQKMLNDPKRLANLLSYHVVHGAFPLAIDGKGPGPNPNPVENAPFANQHDMPQGGPKPDFSSKPPGGGQKPDMSMGAGPKGGNQPAFGGQPNGGDKGLGNAPLGSQPSFTTQVGGLLPVVAQSMDVNPTTITVGRTLMDQSPFVDLEGGRAQVLAWSNSTGPDGKARIMNQSNDCPITKTIMSKYITINIIPSVLFIPTALPWTLQYHKLTNFGKAMKETTVPGAPSNLLESMNSANGWGAHGFTLFAPDNGAMDYAHDHFKSLSSQNPHAMASILQTHMVNGSTIYSPSLCSPHFQYSVVSQAGVPLYFNTNSSGTWVFVNPPGAQGSKGGPMFSARITKTEMLAQNGVVHLIDGVLMNTYYDGAASAAAYDNAKKIAMEHMGPITGPVGPGGVAGAVVQQYRNAARGRVQPAGWNGTGGIMALSVLLGVWFSGIF